MWRGKICGLIIGAVALVAVVGYGDAAETIVKATSSIKGEGRFYKATDQHLLFAGYFQGNVEAEQDDLNQAGLVRPGLMEINRTAGTRRDGELCSIRGSPPRIWTVYLAKSWQRLTSWVSHQTIRPAPLFQADELFRSIRVGSPCPFLLLDRLAGP